MFAIYLLFYKDITILYMHKKKVPPIYPMEETFIKIFIYLL